MAARVPVSGSESVSVSRARHACTRYPIRVPHTSTLTLTLTSPAAREPDLGNGPLDADAGRPRSFYTPSTKITRTSFVPSPFPTSTPTRGMATVRR
jgi:hypothetical protein